MTVKLPIAAAAETTVPDTGAPALAPSTASGSPGNLLAGLGSKLLRVGDLAEIAQKTVRALHLYEELGLLQPVERSKGGYRLYSADSVLRVRWIGKLQELGFSLPEIRELLEGWGASGSASGAMHRMQEIYRTKLAETRAQIERLTVLERELTHTVNYLETCDTCEPERLITSCSRCNHHDCDAPDLVAGLHGKLH